MNTHTHRRYFAYRHKMDGDNQIVQYAQFPGQWVSAIEFAYLTTNLDNARSMVVVDRDNTFTHCIGAVDCTVAGQFVPEII